MDIKNMLNYCLDSLNEIGVDKSQCVLEKEKKYEFNVENKDISLLRTTIGEDLDIVAIKDNKKGNISLNKFDKDSIDAAIKDLESIVDASQVDEGYDISPKQESKEFSKGNTEPDLDKMYKLFDDFITQVDKEFPKVKFDQVIFEFKRIEKYFVNSNGVDFKSTNGIYSFSIAFSSKDGEKTSSFNFTEVALLDLEKDLLDYGTLRQLLKQSEKELESKAYEGKFVGDIIITPDCLNDFINHYARIALQDPALIAGTSKFKNKLNEVVASPKFTLHSNPLSEEISHGSFITEDGFEAKDVTVIKDGVLKSLLISQYGANKTGLERSKNTGGAYVVEPGDKILEELIKGIDKGILVGRFAGGYPSPDGELAGVAKNSFYIENGEIKYPINETMISGNLLDMFKNIKGISKERVNFGTSILPWICCNEITISGK